MIKTVDGLRKALVRQYEKQEADSGEIHRSKQLANLAGKILKSVALELEYANLRKQTPEVKFLDGADK